jgi:hypothetical protein
MGFSFAIAADNMANFLFPSKSLTLDRLSAAMTVRHILPSTGLGAIFECPAMRSPLDKIY